MKKLSTFALLLLAFAFGTAAANAQCSQTTPAHVPVFDRLYECAYQQGPWTNEVTNNYPWSIFTSKNQINLGLIYGIEVYKATTQSGTDNRRIAFAKPWNQPAPYDPYCNNGPANTRWEFTIAQGVQCTNTVVLANGRIIDFKGCSNGKTRTCFF
jgi:hypothetical protein